MQKVADDRRSDPDEIGNRDVGKGANFSSIEKEIALGKQMAQEDGSRQTVMVNDPVIAEYVKSSGRISLSGIRTPGVPFTIKVIDSEEINAFALPGGFFFVNTGILINADSEAEMKPKVSLAHGPAQRRRRQRHPASRRRDSSFNSATIPLIFMGGWTGYTHLSRSAHGDPQRVLQFSAPGGRELITKTEVHDTSPAIRSGVGSSSDFFEKIQSKEKKKPGSMSKVFATHPPTDDRIKNSQKEIQTILKAKPEYVVTTSEFNDVKGRVLALHNRRKTETNDPNRPRLRRGRPAAARFRLTTMVTNRRLRPIRTNVLR